MKHYRTVPFEPTISEKQASKAGSTRVAQELLEAIHRESEGGWSYVRYESIVASIAPGCLGNLFGGAPSAVTYGILVFERDQP